MTERWRYLYRGHEYGPISIDELRHMIQTGQLRPTDLVCRGGTLDWLQVCKVPELASGASETSLPTTSAPKQPRLSISTPSPDFETITPEENAEPPDVTPVTEPEYEWELEVVPEESSSSLPELQPVDVEKSELPSLAESDDALPEQVDLVPLSEQASQRITTRAEPIEAFLPTKPPEQPEELEELEEFEEFQHNREDEIHITEAELIPESEPSPLPRPPLALPVDQPPSYSVAEDEPPPHERSRGHHRSEQNDKIDTADEAPWSSPKQELPRRKRGSLDRRERPDPKKPSRRQLQRAYSATAIGVNLSGYAMRIFSLLCLLVGIGLILIPCISMTNSMAAGMDAGPPNQVDRATGSVVMLFAMILPFLFLAIFGIGSILYWLGKVFHCFVPASSKARYLAMVDLILTSLAYVMIGTFPLVVFLLNSGELGLSYLVVMELISSSGFILFCLFVRQLAWFLEDRDSGEDTLRCMITYLLVKLGTPIFFVGLVMLAGGFELRGGQLIPAQMTATDNIVISILMYGVMVFAALTLARTYHVIANSLAIVHGRVLERT
ncbi:MAG: GYF domain-containing protein [Gemmataceae bacterium]